VSAKDQDAGARAEIECPHLDYCLVRDEPPHFTSATLVRETLAVVLAGGRGSRLGPLTRRRAKPAMPFGGKFRIVDFALSNCINSGIRRIAVVTQYMSQSLLRHTQEGWNFLDGRVREFVEVIPAQQRVGEAWYQGTADAVFQNTDLFQIHKPRYVLILAGDHVYRMDYTRLLLDHVQRHADVTVACIPVPVATAGKFGIVSVDAEGRVVGFEEKPTQASALPGKSDLTLASMGIYIFGAELLYQELARDAGAAASTHDFGRDLLPGLVPRCRVMAHDFARSCVPNGDRPPYWRDVGTIDAYWDASIDLTRVMPELNLYDPNWPILTAEPPLPPAKFVFADVDRRGVALDSLVASGCIVSGAVIERSLLSTNVRVDSYSSIQDSVLLPDTRVGSHVTLRKVIVDRGSVLPDGLTVGVDPEADRHRFYVSEGGITVVTPEMLEAGARAGIL
jgi:glucose-1-phosphate adenylyltransferase